VPPFSKPDFAYDYDVDEIRALRGYRATPVPGMPSPRRHQTGCSSRT